MPYTLTLWAIKPQAQARLVMSIRQGRGVKQSGHVKIYTWSFNGVTFEALYKPITRAQEPSWFEALEARDNTPQALKRRAMKAIGHWPKHLG